jgi:hypothetical protein
MDEMQKLADSHGFALLKVSARRYAVVHQWCLYSTGGGQAWHQLRFVEGCERMSRRDAEVKIRALCPVREETTNGE